MLLALGVQLMACLLALGFEERGSGGDSLSQGDVMEVNEQVGG